MLRHELDRAASATLAASGDQTRNVLSDYIKAVESKRAQDNQAIYAALDKLESQRIADLLSLRKTWTPWRCSPTPACGSWPITRNRPTLQTHLKTKRKYEITQYHRARRAFLFGRHVRVRPGSASNTGASWRRRRRRTGRRGSGPGVSRSPTTDRIGADTNAASGERPGRRAGPVGSTTSRTTIGRLAAPRTGPGGACGGS